MQAAKDSINHLSNWLNALYCSDNQKITCCECLYPRTFFRALRIAGPFEAMGKVISKLASLNFLKLDSFSQCPNSDLSYFYENREGRIVIILKIHRASEIFESALR